MNIKNYYNRVENDYQSFVGFSKLLPFFNMVEELPEYAYILSNGGENIDRLLLLKYGKIKLIDDLIIYRDNKIFYDFYLQIFEGFVASHKNQINSLWNVYVVEYNPLDNFSTTKETIMENGEMNTTNVFGATKTTDTVSQRIISNEYGERTTTDNIAQKTTTDLIDSRLNTDIYGERVINDVKGAKNETTKTDKIIEISKHEKNSFDGGIVLDTQDTNTKNGNGKNGEINTNVSTNSYTDSITNKTYTDTHQSDSYVDTHQSDAYVDTHNIAPYTDTTRNEGYTDTKSSDSVTNTTHNDSFTNKIKEVYRGNLGVSVTTQSLIGNEIDLKNAYNFFEVIFNMFLPYISGGVWCED